MILIECEFAEPTEEHEYPDDWHFGGADELDPRADPRWLPTTYEYYDNRAERIWVTQIPLCDDEALDRFTWVAERGADFNPVWVSAKRPSGEIEMLRWTYDKAQDLLTPVKENA